MPNFEARADAGAVADDQSRRRCALLLALRAQAARNDALRCRIAELESSHSWRLTAPLRQLRAWFSKGRASTAPALKPADAGMPGLVPDAGNLLRNQVGLIRGDAPAMRPATRPLFVDVTELDLADQGAGVQRVVHHLLAELLLEPPAGFRVEPVRLAADGRYVHARAFVGRMLGLPAFEVGRDWPIAASPGAWFLGLDLIRDRALLAGPEIQSLREQGVRIGFVVYDLLPLAHPQWFPKGMDARFADWLQLLAVHADIALCISGTVASQLPLALAQTAGPRRAIDVVSFFLGADHGESILPKTAPAANAAVRFLMVGTIEPRKGHAQALAAFERLWARGSDVELVIAGHAGWSMDGFLQRLRAHPQLGNRLHWIDGADDAALAATYHSSTALLAPSLGEGFGLPLVEAAMHGLPVLARDLPVFREVAGAGADYFGGDDVDAMVSAIEHWLALWRSGRHADPALVTRLTWRESADVLRKLLQGSAGA